MRKVVRFTSAVVAASLLTAVSSAYAQEKLKISLVQSTSSIPGSSAKIAQQLGLFEKHGLDVTLSALDNGGVATAALVSGAANFSTSATTDVLMANARGQQVLAVTNIYGSFAPVVILSKAVADKLGVAKDAPVAERLKALDGVLLASLSASAPFTLALKQSTEAVGAKIRLTYIAQPAMPAALETGAIEGYLASAPYYAQPVLKGSGVVWINGPKGEFPSEFIPASQLGLNTTRAFAEANPEIMKRILAVFDDLAATARNRPADVKAAIASLNPDVDPKILDVIFESEIVGFGRARRLTDSDMTREIAFVKASGVSADLGQLVPANLRYQTK